MWHKRRGGAPLRSRRRETLAVTQCVKSRSELLDKKMDVMDGLV